MKKVKTWTCRKCGCRNGLCRETCWNCGQKRVKRSSKTDGHQEEIQMQKAAGMEPSE